MDDITRMEERTCCPRCGGQFKRGEPHQCGSVHESCDIDASKKSAPSHEEISKRAYELYVARGGADGHDLDDWLQAKHDLCAAGGA